MSTTSTDIGTDWNEVEDDILGRAAGRTDSDDSFLDYKREETELPCRSFTHSGWSEVQDIAGTEGKVQIEFEFPSDKSEFKNYRQKSVFLCCLDSNGRGVFVEPGNTSIDDITEALLNASRSIKQLKPLEALEIIMAEDCSKSIMIFHLKRPRKQVYMRCKPFWIKENDLKKALHN